MSVYSNDFGPFEGKIWLNNASEGPLPKVSVTALHEAISWKINPVHLTNQRFAQVPAKLKNIIGQLLNCDPNDVILGNSATYGIHLLANGIPFKAGEEILLMQNDFPTDILPWLFLKEDGVVVRQLPSRGPVISPEEILNALTAKTRLICLPHVHTFSGHLVDIKAIGKICQERGIIFVVNVAQSLGYLPVDLSSWPVDAITTAGFKWLCGPYGTGFCWIKKDLRESLTYRQAFWINRMSEEELASTGEMRLNTQNSAATYDVFGTANFFNYVPLTSSIEYLLKIGIAQIGSHVDGRVVNFLNNLDRKQYDLISREEPAQRSALIVFTHRDQNKNSSIFRELLEKGIYTAKWKGNIRVSPHIFNTDADIERVLEVLNQRQ
jgi:cysteine desulfurase/selenocysteine lyase